jgi:hypothetical protein
MSDKKETPILDAIQGSLTAKKHAVGGFNSEPKEVFKPAEERSVRERLDTLANVASKDALGAVDEVFRILAGTTLPDLLGESEESTAKK